MSGEVILDPLTRVCGHGRIHAFADGAGGFKNAYFQVTQLRGFEEFSRGRLIEEMPRITSRICGRCSWSHHFAAVKAVESAFDIEPSPTSDVLRRLLHNISHFADGIFEFYYLDLPDMLPSKEGEKDVKQALKRIGVETFKDAAVNRSLAHCILQRLGGRAVHPVSGIPGGLSKGVSDAERKAIESDLRAFLSFSRFTLELFEEVMLEKSWSDVSADLLQTHYMGLVGEKGVLDLYSGKVQVVDPKGKKVHGFDPGRYLEYIEEHVEPWTYATFPYLKKIGWKGFLDGPDSGVYRTGSLARLNAAEKISTPYAQEAYERMCESVEMPCHDTRMYRWARLIEMVHVAEQSLEIIAEPGITAGEAHALPEKKPVEGVGCVEASDGLLLHHYVADDRGCVEKANLINGTNQNNAAMCMSVSKASKKARSVAEIESAIRAYYPCLYCAAH